jgi:hypothetical protein
VDASESYLDQLALDVIHEYLVVARQLVKVNLLA